jgi:DNA-binding Xre family transcriptional regulator
MLRLRIKEVAQERGFSMGKLSRASDVSFNTIKRLMTHPYGGASVETLNKIANALGVTISDLVENVPDEH